MGFAGALTFFSRGILAGGTALASDLAALGSFGGRPRPLGAEVAVFSVVLSSAATPFAVVEWGSLEALDSLKST